MLVLTAAVLVVLLYIYGGYPLLLKAIVRLKGPRPVRRGPGLPSVTLVISAYNEAAVIRAKLENALALDYPDGRLQVVVISDASSDGTDAIVAEFAPRVELRRQAERRGKTAGLNRVVPHARGEVVVFSDANAMYEPDAIRMLVRNFDDPVVGCVTGEARYRQGDRSTAGVSERAYWDYEISVKRLETEVGSMVGGDGAIYAIRRHLWRELPGDAINDFLNPLQIVVAGWRAVYEPEAVAYEDTAGDVRREWRRRIRIVSRSWRAVFQAKGSLNPFKVGLFAFCLWSHKVLRWFSGVLILTAAAAGASVLLRQSGRYGTWLAAALAIALAAALMRYGTRALAFPYYFVAISTASSVGVLLGSLGRVSGVWTPPRAIEQSTRGIRVGILLLSGGALALAAGALTLVFANDRAAAAVFWTAVAAVIYVYVGYPLMLKLLAASAPRPIVKSAIEPRLCLLIAAHNEQDVIATKLENSLSLDYPRGRLEIVVASDGSMDLTNTVVQSFAPRGVRLAAYPARRGKISAINDAMTLIEAEIVVLSDANTFLRPEALRMLVRNFADGQVGAVSGDVVLTGERAALAGSEDLYYRYERGLQRLESSVGSLIGVDGALYAIRRRLFAPPPADTILDDMAIPMAVIRAGYRVAFEESALADEAGSTSAAEEFSRKSRVMAGAVQFLLRRDSSVPAGSLQPLFTLVSHKALRWMSPACAALGFAASAVLARGSTFFEAVLVAELAVLAGGVLGCAPAMRRIGVIGAAHYICLVQTAAAVGFVKGISGRQAVAWRRFTRARVQPV
jgi:cellulose synthase/poly-beta-1,6-N-acetylglucosamine synthase-like glycosyltransferase